MAVDRSRHQLEVGTSDLAAGQRRSGGADVKAVLFDYGGVLTTSTVGAMRAWCEVAGISPAGFAALMRSSGDCADSETSLQARLEIGALDVTEFEKLVAAELFTRHGISMMATGLVSSILGNLRPDEAMLALVDEIRQRGVLTGLLSNSWGNSYPWHLLSHRFDDIVISGAVGLRKPDSLIYDLAAKRLGVKPEECVFVDDVKVNLRAGTAVGMFAVLHTEASVTRAEVLSALELGAHGRDPARSALGRCADS